MKLPLKTFGFALLPYPHSLNPKPLLPSTTSGGSDGGHPFSNVIRDAPGISTAPHSLREIMRTAPLLAEASCTRLILQ